MKVLIIGGTGLISTAITQQLLDRGDAVTLYNRGQRALRVSGRPTVILGDRKEYAAFEARMREAGPFDAVIDMVCFQREEAESLIRALAGRTPQVVFCSSVDVYSKPAHRYPYREDEPYGPLNAYGQGKVDCERALLASHARGDFAVTVIRPALTYGEGGNLVHSFGRGTAYYDRMRKGKPIVVHGDGNSLWVSCHIDDVARAFVGALGNPRAYGKAYHATGEEWMTWNQLHAQVAEALAAPLPELVHIPSGLLASVSRRAASCADNFQFNNILYNAAAHEDLGFRYTVPFIEGVRRTVAWLDANGRIEDSDLDPYDDRIIAAWRRCGAAMARELQGLDD